MSNRLFQGIIHQMGDAANRTIGVIDDTGVIIACSELVKIGEARHGIHDELAYTSDAVTVEGYTYRPIGTAAKWEYIVFVEGEDDTAERLADILSISLSTIKNLYDEKYDKNSFIKNIILDNILPSDIYIKGKELRFNTEEVRVVFLIKFLSRTEVLPFNMVQQIFPDKNKDYVISISEQDIVVVKEIKGGTDIREIEKLARSIADTLGTEFYAKVAIGIGTAVDNIKDLARLQGGSDRDRGRQGIRHRKDGHQLREPRHRTSYLSASHHALRDVPPGSIQIRFSRKPRSRDAHDDPVLLREQPQRVGDFEKALRTPQHSGLPPREDQKADRTRSA